MKKLSVLSLVLFFSLQAAIGQEKVDSTTSTPFIKKSSWLVLPLVFYTPETGWGGGGASLLAFRFGKEPDSTKPSQIQLGFAYTQQKQILSYLPFQLYLNSEKWWLVGELGYYRYVYRFFGIGNTTEKEGESFQAKYPRVRIDVLHQIKPKLYIGGRYWFDDYRITSVENDGLLAQQPITGRQGGKISGLGLVLNYDSRDQIFFPSQGQLAQLVLYSNQQAFGSDFNFNRLTLDVSQYVHFGKEKIIAFNGVVDLLWGNPPFQQLALIGGPKKLRGYFEGRFRDKRLWIIQTEYRMPVYKFIGLVVFGGFGSVANENQAIFSQKVHLAGGAGLRFRISKKDKINIRLDVGINEEGTIYPYLTVGEAF